MPPFMPHAQVYESSLWTTSNTLNPTSLAFDHAEAKLDAFNLFPLFTVRVGMSDVYEGGATSFVDLPLPRQYTSMQQLMASDTFVPTHAGRSEWLGLAGAGDDALERGCNREGFNNKVSTNPGDPWLTVRVGILANPPFWGSGEGSHCEPNYVHSFIGLGAKSFQSVSWPCNSPLNWGVRFSTGALANMCPWWGGRGGQQVMQPKIGYLLGGNAPPAPPPPSPPPPSPPPPSPPPPPPPPPSPSPPPSPPPQPPAPPAPPQSSECLAGYVTIEDVSRRAVRDSELPGYSQEVGGDFDLDAYYRTPCDGGFFSPATWYRFMDAGGFNFVPEAPPGKWDCTTAVTGWLAAGTSGGHPTVAEQVVWRTLCFQWFDGVCQWSTSVQVVQCTGFFMYKFPSSWPICNARVCTSDAAPANFGVGGVSAPTAAPGMEPVSFDAFIAGWLWQGAGGSSAGTDAVIGAGTYAFPYDGSWVAPHDGFGRTTNAQDMSSCFSYPGNGHTTPNCQWCQWYARSAGFYWMAGTYTLGGSVDDAVDIRLIPQSGAAVVPVGSKGCCASAFTFTFTVSQPGWYVMGVQVNNYEFCATLGLTYFTSSAGAGVFSANVSSAPPGLESPPPPAAGVPTVGSSGCAVTTYASGFDDTAFTYWPSSDGMTGACIGPDYAGGGLCCDGGGSAGIANCGNIPPSAVPLIFQLDPAVTSGTLMCLDTDSGGCTNHGCMSAVSSCGSMDPTSGVATLALRDPNPELWQWGVGAANDGGYLQLTHAASGFCLWYFADTPAVGSAMGLVTCTPTTMWSWSAAGLLRAFNADATAPALYMNYEMYSYPQLALLENATPLASTCKSAARLLSSAPAAPAMAPAPAPAPAVYTSCDGQPDGVMALQVGSRVFSSYCVGGYVLLAKLDGRTQTWAYDSSLWTSANTLNPDSFVMDWSEAKLEAYNEMPIASLRVGMHTFDGSDAHWLDISLPRAFPNLLSAMQGGYVATTAGRSAWKALAGEASSLQHNCNVEGIDNWPGSYMHVRLGFLANQEADCNSPDSAIGFGIGGSVWCNVSPVTTGNSAPTDGNWPECGPFDNPPVNMPVFGYILGSPPPP
jgi:hypothetical protein